MATPVNSSFTCLPRGLSFSGVANRAHIRLGPSPIRLVSDTSPVKSVNTRDFVCGIGAQKADMVVPATPGSKVIFQWVGVGGSNVCALAFGADNLT